MNSLKSSCSFAKSAPVPIHQFEKDVEPFLGRQASIKLVVGLFGILETAKYPANSRHALDFSTPPAPSLSRAKTRDLLVHLGRARSVARYAFVYGEIPRLRAG
jgi:hypothetical protein